MHFFYSHKGKTIHSTLSIRFPPNTILWSAPVKTVYKLEERTP